MLKLKRQYLSTHDEIRGTHLKLWKQVGGPGKLAASGLHVQGAGQGQDLWQCVQQACRAAGLQDQLCRINKETGL